MIDATHRDIRAIAVGAGWSGDTLLFLITRWAGEMDPARALFDHLHLIAPKLDRAGAFD